MSQNIKKKLSELAIFQGKNGEIILKEDFENETLWLNLNQIADLFGKNKSTISRHIKNIFESGELSQKSVVAKNATTASDGKTYQVEFFNLDLIISVGYRVDSKQATDFRIWATKTLKDHITKGFTINKNQIQNNYQNFLKAVEDLKLLNLNGKISSDQILDLVKTFAGTWLNLEHFVLFGFCKKLELILKIKLRQKFGQLGLCLSLNLIQKIGKEGFD